MNQDTFSLNSVLPADGSIPEWIELLPPGPDISGRDGRAWILPDPNTVIRAFAANQAPLPIDWEHASEVRARQGLDAPAAGWITDLESRGGAIWGKVDWTEPAAQQIGAKQYRYISPVFLYSAKNNAIIALVSAGLTNQPNLKMTALNRAEDVSMSLPAALCNALSIPPNADESAALSAIVKLQNDLAVAANRAETPPLERFVPRADYDATLARASNAEAKLAEAEKAQQKAEIDGLIDAALKAKKIVPATADYYRAMCATGGGVDAFKEFVKVAPALLQDSGLEGKSVPDQSKSMNRADFFALSPAKQAEFVKTGGAIIE